MKRPDPSTITALAQTAMQHPQVRDWISDWCRQEMEQLPAVVNNVALAQGRCQVLKELRDLVEKAPALAAQPDPRVAAHTHTNKERQQ